MTIDDLKIKIFADGADLTSINKLNSNKIISGFTTNPSLMKKAGVKDYKKFCQEVLKITKDKPVSFEIFSDNLHEMYDQAREIASWGKSIFVKMRFNFGGVLMNEAVNSTRVEYLNHIEKQKRSGLSIKKYCEQNN